MASHMNFEICNFEDFLSISHKETTLPKIQLDFPFVDNIPSYNCNDSHEMPSIFQLDSVYETTMETKPLVHGDYVSVPLGFMAFLFVEFLFIVSLLTISLWSSIMIQINKIKEYFATGYALTFVGIKPPKDCHISTHSMFDRIDTTKTIQTVYTKLQSTNTIHDLKDTIRSTYNIPNTMDILIVFAHHIISNDKLTLNECGIVDRSLLTLALCPSGKVEEATFHFNGYTPEVPVSVIRNMESDDAENVEFDPNEMNAFFGMYSDDESSDDEEEVMIERIETMFDSDSDDDEEEELDPNAPRLGFDIVMQEDNVKVYQMAKCGHVMNPESLYHYALSQYSDKNNLSVECPHFWCEVPCKTKWDYHDILDVLRRDGGDYEFAKLELLASRNRVQDSCNVQKCPRCNTLYFQNDSEAPSLGEIDSKEDVERCFKFECTFCSFIRRKWQPYYTPKEIETEHSSGSHPFSSREQYEAYERAQRMRNDLLDRWAAIQHNEDGIEEEVDGAALNSMFRTDSDSESDSESESEYEVEVIGSLYDSDEEEEERIIQRIENMFDYEEEPEKNRVIEMLENMYQCTKDITVKMYKFMAPYMMTVYTYLTTNTLGEMVEDAIVILEKADTFLYDTYQSVKTLIVRSARKMYQKVHGIYKKLTTCPVRKDKKIESHHERSDAMDFKVMKVPTGPRLQIRRRAGVQHDLSDGGIFSQYLSSDSDDTSEDDMSDFDEDGYIEYIEYELDSDSEAEEEERVNRIEHIFDDDGISDCDEEETEEKVALGYDEVTTLHDAFCWGCGVEWEEGHVCDSSFKQDMCNILAMADKKTIGEQENIPSIRCCPHCQMLITHTQACKHMDCRNCKKAFCFVCLKPRLDSGWQCGSYSSRCPDGVAPVQGMDALPDAIVITKNAFHLY